MRDASNQISPTLRAGNNGGAVTPAVAFGIQGNIIERSDKHGGNGKGWSEEICGTQTTGDKHAVCTPDMIIRRLTPVECERLQGFPDNYTLIPTWHSKIKEEHLDEAVQYLIKHGYDHNEATQLANHPDGHRYAALGNSMAVPVIKWIGERIESVETTINSKNT